MSGTVRALRDLESKCTVLVIEAVTRLGFHPGASNSCSSISHSSIGDKSDVADARGVASHLSMSEGQPTSIACDAGRGEVACLSGAYSCCASRTKD